MARRCAPVFAAALVLAVTGCTAPLPREAPPRTAVPQPDAVRMAAIGDSITDGDSIDFAGGVPGPQSWVSYAIGPDLDFVGGWAEWGATTDRMASAIQDPIEADVLVLVAGTNDAGWVSHAETGENLVHIAATAEVDTVLLSSIPPTDFASSSKTELNQYLAKLAQREGWDFVDGAADLRDGEVFVPGMSYDGVHLTEAGARVLGEAIGSAAVTAARE